jgi:hypothetical protein
LLLSQASEAFQKFDQRIETGTSASASQSDNDERATKTEKTYCQIRRNNSCFSRQFLLITWLTHAREYVYEARLTYLFNLVTLLKKELVLTGKLFP